MKTPLQELIEIYQEMRENGETDLRTVIHYAKRALEKERQMVIDARKDSFKKFLTTVNGVADENNLNQMAEQYFDNTFGEK